MRVALLLACPLFACASVPAPVASPLLGAWRAPPLRSAPCAFELALFDDGSAEVNYIDDDSDEELCAFVAVPFTIDGDVLSLGGAATCRVQLVRASIGDALHVACEDHGRPPATLDDAVVMRRTSQPIKLGQAAVAGRWAATPRGSVALSLDADGSGALGDDSGLFDARDDGTATFTFDGKASECRYRATEERLALRCAEPGQPAPTTLAGKGALVLVRAR